ncbi:SusC/RagA family TonB-linked outer membrane protein [Xanthovirga aplysinae]|uniref:SusC/RagA family TonB-linked outer membrane protein n=1 Tax=Xanthovirga aplysinae TaxID=2529853 RepID=UPI0012BCBC8A|nr:TonB-dependent receptor [Xanthovirga aplysinae]MTI30699.1 TonB-dependent receptor [Xanthovirga aplysinae]
MIRKLLLLVFMLTALGWQQAMAQSLTVSGTVTSEEDGLGLPGVNVLLKGTTVGVQTDLDGKFSLEAPSQGSVLVFSFVGLESQEVSVDGKSVINVSMAPDDQLLEEVVVVGYGTAKKGSLTGSSVQINAESLENRALTNVTSALEGAAGVQFAPASGQPGESAAIRIRGIGSINGSNVPLYVVDGMIFTGTLASLNANDIESFSILKDAASTAIYGSKAANGVVLITTKTGSKGKSKVSVNFSQGASSRFIPEYDRVDAGTYYELMWESLRNRKVYGQGKSFEIANQEASEEAYDFVGGTNPYDVPNDQIVGTDGKLNPGASLIYEDLDWAEPLMRNGARTNFDVSFEGGNEKSDYFVSLGYVNEKGWLKRSNFERISGRTRVNFQPQKWFKTGVNLSAASSNGNQTPDGGSSSYQNSIRSARFTAPIYPVYLHKEDGSYDLDENDEKQYDLGDNRLYNRGRHPIYESLLNTDNDINLSLNSRAYMDFTFLKDFKFTLNAGLEKRNYYNELFWNKIVGDGAPNGFSYRFASYRTTKTFNQLLNYSKTIGKHNISALIGHENFDYQYNYLEADRTKQITDGNIELINFAVPGGAESAQSRYTTEGYFFRGSYDFDEKYFLSASFRRDGSSRFSKKSRWGNFWSVGGAWRLDKEFNLPTWADMLKLRASYGQVGNDSHLNTTALGFYASQPLFELGKNNQGEPGIWLDQVAAPDLAWESNNQTDIGLEFGLFDYRISGTVEYYNRETADLLFYVPLPESTGLSGIDANVGTMANSGLEITLSGEIIRRKDFIWQLDLNASTLKNKIKELPQEEIIDDEKRLFVGGDIYNFYIRKWYGVDPDDGAALYVLDSEADKEHRDVRVMADGTYVTTNPNYAQYYDAGSALPDVFGSFTHTFTYKGLSLGLFFTYQLGGQLLDWNYTGLMHPGTAGTALHTDILNRWQKPGDVTDVPRLDYSQASNFVRTYTDRWLTSSDFLHLRQISLAYDLPSKLISRTGLESVRIYGNVENVFLLNARNGLWGTQYLGGTTGNEMTPSRVMSVGLNVTF